jgi:hypothetical protein
VRENHDPQRSVPTPNSGAAGRQLFSRFRGCTTPPPRIQLGLPKCEVVAATNQRVRHSLCLVNRVESFASGAAPGHTSNHTYLALRRHWCEPARMAGTIPWGHGRRTPRGRTHAPPETIPARWEPGRVVSGRRGTFNAVGRAMRRNTAGASHRPAAFLPGRSARRRERPGPGELVSRAASSTGLNQQSARPLAGLDRLASEWPRRTGSLLTPSGSTPPSSCSSAPPVA